MTAKEFINNLEKNKKINIFEFNFKKLQNGLCECEKANKIEIIGKPLEVYFIYHNIIKYWAVKKKKNKAQGIKFGGKYFDTF